MIAGRAIASLSPIGRAEAATPARSVVRWTVQVGAYRAKVSATRAGDEARAHAAAMHGKPVVVVATRSPHGAIYTARVTGMTQNEAKAACDTLHREHRACTVLGPSLQVAGQKAGTVRG
jgi:D-alanyl-D-alanine carboxypeptidase